jgi:hypothetical protein
MISRSWSSASAAPHSAPLAAALTCAQLWLTRRRLWWPPQVHTWPAPPFLATLHSAFPAPPPCPTPLGLVPNPRPEACAGARAQRTLILPVQSPPLDTQHTHAHAHTHAHTHTHTHLSGRAFARGKY